MATYTITEAGPSTSIPFESSTNIFSETENQKSSQLVLGPSANDEAPPNAVDALQKWSSPRINMYRVFTTFWTFLIMGMGDGSYGALIPFLEKYYDLSYTVVSLIFLSPFVGYTFASLVNDSVHVRFGQRGVAILGPSCHLIPYIVLAIHPPYPVLVVVFIFVGFGNGLVDAAWCSWIGNMANANQVSGFLQACYSLGATISPLIATALVDKQHVEWYTFYYIMISFSAVELIISTIAFWKQTGKVYQTENPRDPNVKSGRTREALGNKLTWMFALFIFGYVGAEVSLGGWIITFMTSVRHATSLTAASTSTGFWAGMTAGRLCLSFLTAYLGEFRSVCLYLGITVGLELIFWLVPSLVVSALSVALLGFFMGPMFPTAIVLMTKLLPRHLHVKCVGFATAFGGSGGAVFPFAVGALAQTKGVKTLQPVILALLGGIAALWILVPKQNKKRDEEVIELAERS